MAKGCKSKKATSTTAKLLAMFLAIGLLAVLGTAGLLTYYAQVVGTVNVQQSVRVDGTQCIGSSGCQITDNLGTQVAGTVVYKKHTIENYASQGATISITADESSTGIDVKYYLGSKGESLSCGEISDDEYQDSISSTTIAADSVGDINDYELCIKYILPINLAPTASGSPYEVTTTIAPVTS